MPIQSQRACTGQLLPRCNQEDKQSTRKSAKTMVSSQRGDVLLWKLHRQLKRAIIEPSTNSSKHITPRNRQKGPTEQRASTYIQYRRGRCQRAEGTRDTAQCVAEHPCHLPGKPLHEPPALQRYPGHPDCYRKPGTCEGWSATIQGRLRTRNLLS